MHDMIREQLNRSVPFAAHAGVNLTSLSPEAAVAELEQTPSSINHIGSQHAGALFTLGEAASGAAMAGAFAPVLLDIRPVTSNATIRYTRVAKGRITATARVVADAKGLLEKLASDGKVAFDVDVSMTDEAGAEVAQMQVKWHVSRRRSDA